MAWAAERGEARRDQGRLVDRRQARRLIKPALQALELTALVALTSVPRAGVSAAGLLANATNAAVAGLVLWAVGDATARSLDDGVVEVKTMSTFVGKWLKRVLAATSGGDLCARRLLVAPDEE